MSLIQNYEYIRDWVNNRFLQELQSYYNKSYIDDAIQDLIQRITDAIAGVTQFDYVICESTHPVTGKKGTIYFVPSGSGENVYDEYLYIDNKWEKLGPQLDLSSKQDVISDLDAIRSGASAGATAVQPAALNSKQDIISDLATIRSGASLGATAYQKPSSGIGESDLSDSVNTSLDLADTAVQANVIGELYPEINPGEYANTVQLTKNGQPIYPVTDASLVIGLNKCGLLKSVFAWDGESIPSIANIPEGVSVTYEASTYTGTLSPSADAVGTVYLVANGNGEFDKYIIDATGGSYTWKKAGTTAITSPIIVDNLETDDSQKALSAAQGYVLDGKVSQLEAKVDDLSTGKYYGYFAKEEDLPEADVDGFAYVGEGPTYTIYNCVGGVWTSSDITVNQSPIGNDEDIDQNEDGKLQFANRVYNAQQPNGMGYKILRKDATFASQVTDTNTIYEIRYDFNLGNTTVTIPSGCILRFDGGCINNGVLSGNNTSIIGGDYKIFNGVTFAGTWKGDINACWIGARQNDSTFDNSPILQAWFDNYCEYFPGIVFPYSVYYFSSAVVLSSDKKNKHIYGDGSVFNVNISTDDSVFITLNVGEAFSLRDVKIQNVRNTGTYNISKTTALHLIQTHQFGIQGVEFRNFDKGVWLTDVWYGNFYGKNSFWQNRIAIFVDTTVSQEVNTIDFHNIRVTGCVLDAAKTLYPQESGEGETDWALRYARCGVDVHCSSYAVKYSGMVIEGVDYGIRYNYRPRATNSTIDALIVIENCYFEGNTKNDIYIGKGYVINPDNLANYYVISGGFVKIDSCLFHSTLDKHIFIKDCYTSIKNCTNVSFSPAVEYGRSVTETDLAVGTPPVGGTAAVRKVGTTLQFPSSTGSAYPATIRQSVGNIRNQSMMSALLHSGTSINIDTMLYVSNGTGVGRFIPSVQGMTDAPRVNVSFGIQPYEMDIRDNAYFVRIPSGNGSVRVKCAVSQYTPCVYSFRNDGIEITEFIRRWKAGTAYTGYVNQVFPFKVRSVPSEGKLYMENYQGVESLIGVGKKAIDDGFSFSTGYYIFVEALCYIFFAYSSPRVISDLVQCGRSYSEMGLQGSSTAAFDKFRFVCSDTQRGNLRPRMNAVIYNTTSKQLQIYDGTQWVELTDTFKRYVYADKGVSITARATAPDLPGQTYFNYATGITYRYAILSEDRYTGAWFGDIGSITDLDHPNGYDSTTNPLDYATELTAGEMVRYNGNIIRWNGTSFENLDGTTVNP